MKTIFKLCAVLFVINMFNIVASLTFIIYKWIGLFKVANYFLEDLFIGSMFAIFPLSWALIEMLTTTPEQKSNGNTI